MLHKQEIVKLNNTCVAFGNFDGVHKGHSAVLEKLVEEANKQGLSSLVLSLYPAETQVLTTEEEKAFFLEKSGLDLMISCELTEQIKQMSAEYFVKTILIEQLGAKVIVTGKDCCFGGKQDGNLALLTNTAKAMGVQIITCETVTDGDKPISSKMLKEAFEASDFEGYMNICGHPYVMIGEVVHGKALGRTVGIPTANLGVCVNKLMPPSGVYATVSTVDNEVYKGLTNIGKRPSVDNLDLITIETFLLDFSKDIYGKTLVLEVYFYIRGVIKFNNLAEVQNQVQKDLENIRLKLSKIDNTK